MIARLLISPNLDLRKKGIEQLLRLNLEGYRTNSHPDLLYISSDSKLGIAEARKIKEHFSLKPYSAKGRVVVLEDGGNLTDEAQNALLKTLEELPENALFILGAESESKFLPTVLSRCEIIQKGQVHARSTSNVGSSPKNVEDDIKKLLAANIEQRFEFIEKLKDREELLHSLLEYFHQTLNVHSGSGNSNVKFLKELLEAEKWQKQNVNIRTILEYLMLVMPQKSW